MARCEECLHYELCSYNTYEQAKYFGKDKEVYITIKNNTACKFFNPTADVAPKSEVAKELLSDLKKAVHDKAVYPHNEEFAFINLRVFDTVIQSYLKKYAESDP